MDMAINSVRHGSMVGIHASRAMRVLQAFSKGSGRSSHVLVLRALADRRVVSPLPAPAGDEMPRLREGAGWPG